jgi:hypothetical protein
MTSRHKVNRPWLAWVLIILGVGGILIVRFHIHRVQDAAAEEVAPPSRMPLRTTPIVREDSLAAKPELVSTSSVSVKVAPRRADSLPAVRHFYERISTEEGGRQLQAAAPYQAIEKADSLPGSPSPVSDPVIVVHPKLP